MPAISLASDADRRWGAEVMGASEPWRSLGRTAAQCRDVLFDARYQVLVAADVEGGGPPVGIAIVDPKGLAGAPYLKSIVVDPDARSRGVGTALLAHVERELGIPGRNMFLCVSSFNVRARALYERLGYTMVGELTDFLVPGASELILRKRLDSE
jgi:ribosomal protein S18 acetylase RimI-like enzyme